MALTLAVSVVVIGLCKILNFLFNVLCFLLLFDMMKLQINLRYEKMQTEKRIFRAQVALAEAVARQEKAFSPEAKSAIQSTIDYFVSYISKLQNRCV